jgi:hypothetical protein
LVRGRVGRWGSPGDGGWRPRRRPAGGEAAPVRPADAAPPHLIPVSWPLRVSPRRTVLVWRLGGRRGVERWCGGSLHDRGTVGAVGPRPRRAAALNRHNQRATTTKPHTVIKLAFVPTPLPPGAGDTRPGQHCSVRCEWIPRAEAGGGEPVGRCRPWAPATTGCTSALSSREAYCKER